MKRKIRKKRMIEQIRCAFPDLKWTYEWPSTYKSSAGWDITGYSCLSYGEDSGGWTEWRRSDTGELVWGFGGYI